MEKPFGIFVGRFSPVHLGHAVVIRNMVEVCGLSRSLVVLGSSNAPMSFRHLFSYEDRRGFIKKLFPEIPVIGLPDYPTNEEWLLALDDIIRLCQDDIFKIKHINPLRATYFGGCEEDVHFFLEFHRKCQLLNRFDGSTPKISATEVRDALIQGRSLENLLDSSVIEDVKRVFAIKWDRFRKM